MPCLRSSSRSNLVTYVPAILHWERPKVDPIISIILSSSMTISASTGQLLDVFDDGTSGHAKTLLVMEVIPKYEGGGTTDKEISMLTDAQCRCNVDSWACLNVKRSAMCFAMFQRMSSKWLLREVLRWNEVCLLLVKETLILSIMEVDFELQHLVFLSYSGGDKDYGFC